MTTKYGKDTPEHCCRSELMDHKSAPNKVFSMFEAFYEAIENFKASVSIG